MAKCVLPCASLEGPASLSVSHHTRSAEKTSMARILVIDDDDSIRVALRKILEIEGHEVVDATNGVHGLRLYHQQPAALVITDILMPEKEGFEVIRELLRENPDVKIIAMSGNISRGGPDFLPQAGDMGASRTLPKPFSREDALKVVRAVLGDPEGPTA